MKKVSLTKMVQNAKNYSSQISSLQNSAANNELKVSEQNRAALVESLSKFHEETISNLKQMVSEIKKEVDKK